MAGDTTRHTGEYRLAFAIAFVNATTYGTGLASVQRFNKKIGTPERAALYSIF